MSETIDVQLRPIWIEGIGYRYNVLLDGELIVRRSRHPEHEAARALLARGLSGKFLTIDFATGQPRMELDIEKAARLRTVERAEGGFCVVPYLPMAEHDKARLLAHRSSKDATLASSGRLTRLDRVNALPVRPLRLRHAFWRK